MTISGQRLCFNHFSVWLGALRWVNRLFGLKLFWYYAILSAFSGLSRQSRMWDCQTKTRDCWIIYEPALLTWNAHLIWHARAPRAIKHLGNWSKGIEKRSKDGCQTLARGGQYQTLQPRFALLTKLEKQQRHPFLMTMLPVCVLQPSS